MLRNYLESIAQAIEDGKENLDEDGQPPEPLSADPEQSPEPESDGLGADGDSAVSRLVDLLYFSQVTITPSQVSQFECVELKHYIRLQHLHLSCLIRIGI